MATAASKALAASRKKTRQKDIARNTAIKKSKSSGGGGGGSSKPITTHKAAPITTHFKQNPANVAAGIDASKQTMDKAGQTVGTPAPNFSPATGGSAFVPPPGQTPAEQLASNPLLGEGNALTDAIQGIGGQSVEQQQQSLAEQFNEVAASVELDPVDFLGGTGLVTKGGVAAGKATKGVLKLWTNKDWFKKLDTISKAGKKFMDTPAEMLADSAAGIVKKESLKSFEKRILSGVAKPPPLTTKLIKTLKSGLQILTKNKKSASLIIASIVGAFGIGTLLTSQGVYLAGQTKDDEVDTVSSPLFVGGQLLRDSKNDPSLLDEALSLVNTGLESGETIKDADGFFENFNFARAGKLKMDTDLIALEALKKDIVSQIEQREQAQFGTSSAFGSEGQLLGQSDFAKEREFSDLAARDRDLKFRDEDTAFFEGLKNNRGQQGKQRQQQEFNQTFNQQFNKNVNENFTSNRADVRVEEQTRLRALELEFREEDSEFYSQQRLDKFMDEFTWQGISNNQELQFLDQKNKLYLQSQAQTRAADSRQMRENKQFLLTMNRRWEQEKAELAAAERVATAKFWAEFNKQKREEEFKFFLSQKAPSKLSFGLL